ncbi:MAG TPA: hypothetical protein VGI26_03210 [Solirubrobacteraceae bacterium]|jgi:hypothetical protein
MGKLLSAVSLAACGVLMGVLASGCGESARNAHEVAATYRVEVVRAAFPARQAIARDTRLALVVRNRGNTTIPNVAVTLDSLSYTSAYPLLSANKRPVWVVNNGPGAISARPVETEQIDAPGGGETAYVNTWALGALAPRTSKAFVWRVTPVKAGVHVVHYAISAGLDGKALARLRGGGLAAGKFVVAVARKPPTTHVNPETGQIAPGRNPVPLAPQPAAP